MEGQLAVKRTAGAVTEWQKSNQLCPQQFMSGRKVYGQFEQDQSIFEYSPFPDPSQIIPDPDPNLQPNQTLDSARPLQVYSRRKVPPPTSEPIQSSSLELQDVEDSQAQEAFEKLKKAMTSLPVLAMLDFTCPFEIEATAVGLGMRDVLVQKGQPIVYFSQALLKRNQQCSVYVKELMAIVFDDQKWRHYL
ncbi:Retrovirus-related Pol polyprotein from transposon 297 family [Senna tora]|uniref:Retrovirus-related Pol polyprotein from transposon 297 family n=1 Tax=Senna tora TaxID=362788 RepID=A0A834X9G3_9FABA|nr:Retrovirus-related Pol polyprotein from transposon 297 family [Senna tora]